MAFTYKAYTPSDDVNKAYNKAQQYSQYKENENVTNARNAMQAHENNKVAAWTGGSYGEALKQSIDKINNRQKFSFDLNGDALYQQYKDQYMNLGRLAMQDTMGQAASLTGGYGNSYAQTVGNQAYQSYLQRLNDVVPQLYQMAYDRYDREGDELKDQYNIYNDAYGREYGEYRDTVTDWNNEAERLSNRYYNEANLDYSRFSTDRDYYQNVYQDLRTNDYKLYSDAYQRAFQEYQQAQQEAQAAAAAAAAAAARSSGGGGGGGRSYSSGGGGSSSSSSAKDSAAAATAAAVAAQVTKLTNLANANVSTASTNKAALAKAAAGPKSINNLQQYLTYLKGI